MKPEDLFREGRLEEAIEVLGADLRADPSNVEQRTFLFELLCFAGDYERADSQLQVLADANKETMLGAVAYRAALNAERTRRDMFEQATFPGARTGTELARGKLNGRPFESICDADPRIGDHLELFAAGDYLWIAFRHISWLEIEPPKRLRDLVWIPAKFHAANGFGDGEFGEALLPALCPLSWQHSDEAVRLGRATEWCRDENGVEAPYGRKMLLVDDEEFPLLEIRSLQIETPNGAA
jgi:type VI secretion system protein ImpE